MGFTKVIGSGIKTTTDARVGILTAERFDGPFTDLTVTNNLTVGGALTYEDVTNVDSIGIITARDYIHVGAGISIVGVATATTFKGDGDFVELDVDGHTNLDNVNVAGVTTFASTVNAATINATLFSGPSEVGIQSGGIQIGAGVTQLNFIGVGNTFKVSGTTVDVSISGNTGAGGTWSVYTAGIATTKSVGVNTNSLDDNDLVGVGNSFQGLYVSNGMYIHDNSLNGNHYIGTAYNGLMAGPVTINGVLTIDGNYVVV
jgi:hypothetical protein